MAELLIVVGLMLLISAWASGTEAALFAMRVSKVHSALERGARGAAALSRIKEDMSPSIMTIVVINNIANISGSLLVGKIAEQQYGSLYLGSAGIQTGDGAIPVVGLISAVLTFLVITCSEVIPKTIGERQHERISLWMAPLVLSLRKLMSPFNWLIDQLTGPVAGLVSRFIDPVVAKGPVATTSEEEIMALTELGMQHGVIEADESELIQRVFQLNDVTAWDIMTPLAKVDALDASETLGVVRSRLPEITHTRLPVYQSSMDQISGVVHLRDLLQALADGREELDVQSLTKPPSFIPSTAVGDDLLRHFKRTKQHLAIVVDAFGTVLGVLTLEDVLEELVGDIIDETDVEHDIQRIGPDVLLVTADTDAVDVNQAIKTELPDKRIGALLIEELGRIPVQEESHCMHGVEFTIVEATPRMIERVRLRKLSEEELPPKENGETEAAS